MIARRLLSCFTAVVVLAAIEALPAKAWGGCCHACGSDGCGYTPCQNYGATTYQSVQKTIMVPTLVTEMQTINVVQCRPEQRQYTYTVMRAVPQVQTVSCDYVVPTYETRAQTVNYLVCRPVMNTVSRQVTVMVPSTETRQANCQVCRMVQVTKTRAVCEDQGHWEQHAAAASGSGCGTCCATPPTCNVWVPNIVTRQVPYTCLVPQMQQVAYQYQVTVCHPEQRTISVPECHYVQEQRSQQVQYVVCVPVRKTESRQVTTYQCVPEQRTATCTVMVPYTVAKQVPVQVCRMVSQTITCQVPTPACDGDQSAGCGAGCNY